VLERLHNCGINEDETWLLYESGAADSTQKIKKEIDSDNDDEEEEMCFAKNLSLVEAASLEEARKKSTSSHNSAIKRS